RPGHNNVKPTPLSVFEHLVQPGPGFAALGTANSGIMVLVDNFPTPALSDLTQFAKLVLNRLSVGRNADVDRSPFPHPRLPLCGWIIPSICTGYNCLSYGLAGI